MPFITKDSYASDFRKRFQVMYFIIFTWALPCHATSTSHREYSRTETGAHSLLSAENYRLWRTNGEN